MVARKCDGVRGRGKEGARSDLRLVGTIHKCLSSVGIGKVDEDPTA